LTIEGTSNTKTLVEQLFYATLLELEKSKVEAIKWKRMEKRSKGKQKEDGLGEMERQIITCKRKFK
jgi:hypothetical protein